MEKATEFLELMGIDLMIDGRIKEHIKQLLMTFNTKEGDKVEDIAKQERPGKAAVIVGRALQETRGELRQKIVEVWATRFTPEEFDELIAFYKTPTGRRAQAMGDEITVAITEACDAWSEASMRAHEADLLEVLGDLLGAGPPQPQ